MTVYLIWCLEESQWTVHSVYSSQEAAEERVIELEEDYGGEYTVTTTCAKVPR